MHALLGSHAVGQYYTCEYNLCSADPDYIDPCCCFTPVTRLHSSSAADMDEEWGQGEMIMHQECTVLWRSFKHLWAEI